MSSVYVLYLVCLLKALHSSARFSHDGGVRSSNILRLVRDSQSYGHHDFPDSELLVKMFGDGASANGQVLEQGAVISISLLPKCTCGAETDRSGSSSLPTLFDSFFISSWVLSSIIYGVGLFNQYDRFCVNDGVEGS